MFQWIDCVVLKAAVDIHHSQVATIAFTRSVLNLHQQLRQARKHAIAQDVAAEC